MRRNDPLVKPTLEPDSHAALLADLRCQRHGAGARTYARLYAPDLQMYGDLEDAPAGYAWNGMKRGADPAHPLLLFQYTLDGWGCFEDRSGATILRPGMGFSAILPSEHRYYLPRASSGWAYIWLIIAHPYIVQRVATGIREHGAITTLAPTDPLLLRLVALHASYQQQRPHDPVAREEMLFGFLWEYERLCYHRRPEADRERLLAEVRQFVIAALGRPVGVDELARWRGTSRSNFSHFFSATTGLAPAAFIQQVRLDEATQRLLHTQQRITEIADATGFASPNHFCKVFRQHFHLSPGAFRRQMG